MEKELYWVVENLSNVGEIMMAQVELHSVEMTREDEQKIRRILNLIRARIIFLISYLLVLSADACLIDSPGQSCERQAGPH